ncbi:MAG: EAL domain-containing protein [Crocosphaera sp.]|nr:EAL domain-containing protein [Crocosphaera sp.]
MKTSNQRNRYLLIIEDKKYRQTLSLEEEIYSIGRSKRSSIVINSEQASRHHATLMRRTSRVNNEETYWILDGDIDGNKSCNGIYVNGEKCLVRELKQGDLVNFGCEVNATFYVMNKPCQTITPINHNHIQSEPATCLSSQSIQVSLASMEVSSSEILNVKPKFDHQSTINPLITLQGEDYQDPLTKLANQNLFKESLSIALKNATRNEFHLGIMFLDINHFREINNRWGYETGDHILEEVARRLNNSLRGSDMIARWRDDQFAILFTQIEYIKEINVISQRILKTIQHPLVISENRFYLEFSQGIAIYPQDGQDSEILLSKAEFNLSNHQKEMVTNRSLNQLVVKDKAAKLSKIKSVLQKELQQEKFLLHYQPQINIKTGEVTGMEALVRWNNQELGLILPNKFISVAEQTEVIHSLGEWVLKAACDQHIAWKNMGLSTITISVNISSIQLKNPDFLKSVQKILEETKIEPQWLQFELTEQAILENTDIIHETLNHLKELGIKLCLDDFGSGYSSLSHLIELPFDTIKIAQSCVKDINKNEQKLLMISAALNLAKTLQIRAIIEGVETQEQQEALSHLDCQEMQGYLLSKPLNKEEANRFLSVNHKTLDSDNID